QDPAPAPSPEAVPAHAPSAGVCDGCRSLLGCDAGSAQGGLWTADAGYAFWSLHGRRANFPIAATGPLGALGTVVLENVNQAENVRTDPGSGARLGFGYWLVDDNPWVPGGIRCVGAEAKFFFVGQRSGDSLIQCLSPLVRPFCDAATGMESAF